MSLETGFIRVAVSGDTVDGRKIDPAQLEAMAANYDTDFYIASIWVEHLRSLSPDGAFRSMGTVTALRAEKINAGKLKGQVGLFAKLNPNAELVAMVRNGQKLFTSIEINPDMPKVNGAYLMGLAVTDSPASLGTSILKFNARNPQFIYSLASQEPLSLTAEYC